MRKKINNILIKLGWVRQTDAWEKEKALRRRIRVLETKLEEIPVVVADYNPFYRNGKCPECGSVVDRDEYHSGYCGCCGVALRWPTEDK